MNEELKRTIMSTGDLPPMPIVATKVIQLVESGNADASDIAKAISSDPAVSARVLKISNSTFYGCRRKIQTLSEAVVVLGHSTLKGLAVAASVKEIYKPAGLTENMLWEHSFGAAVAAKLIAGRIPHISADEAFLAGLFHDLGKIIMNLKEKDRFRQLVERCYNEMQSFEEIESTVFPYTHAELGGCVLEKWNLPESLITSVMHHHSFDFNEDEDDYNKKLTAIVALADLLCNKLGIGSRTPIADEDLTASEASKILELDEDTLKELEDAVADAYEKNKEFFRLK